MIKPLLTFRRWGHHTVVLSQFAPDHAKTLFELIDRNRDHLSAEGIAEKYPTLESVRASITHPPNPAKLRMGIWYVGVGLVGSVNLTPRSQHLAEIGYWVGSEYGGRGFATLAANWLAAYTLEDLDFTQVTAGVKDPAHTASQKVLTRAGFELSNQKDEHGGLVFHTDREKLAIAAAMLKGQGIPKKPRVISL